MVYFADIPIEQEESSYGAEYSCSWITGGEDQPCYAITVSRCEPTTFPS